MFIFSRNFKSQVAVAAAAVTGAFAVPARASATPLWNDNGSPITSTETIHGAGTITMGIAGGAFTTSCNVTNTGSVGPLGVDSVASFTFSGCGTNIAGCTVTAASSHPFPWAGQLVSGIRDQIAGVTYSYTYGGASCPFEGPFPVSGTLSPTVTNRASGVSLGLDLSAGTVTTPWGAATVTGTLSDVLDSGDVLSVS
jgi:hypothetical protein